VGGAYNELQFGVVIKSKECQDLTAFVRSRWHAHTITAVVVEENKAGLHFRKANSVVERRNDSVSDHAFLMGVLKAITSKASDCGS
jgi:hypothetical protein